MHSRSTELNFGPSPDLHQNKKMFEIEFCLRALSIAAGFVVSPYESGKPYVQGQFRILRGHQGMRARTLINGLRFVKSKLWIPCEHVLRPKITL